MTFKVKVKVIQGQVLGVVIAVPLHPSVVGRRGHHIVYCRHLTLGDLDLDPVI
jgi:hypothetical protein